MVLGSKGTFTLGERFPFWHSHIFSDGLVKNYQPEKMNLGCWKLYHSHIRIPWSCRNGSFGSRLFELVQPPTREASSFWIETLKPTFHYIHYIHCIGLSQVCCSSSCVSFHGNLWYPARSPGNPWSGTEESHGKMVGNQGNTQIPCWNRSSSYTFVHGYWGFRSSMCFFWYLKLQVFFWQHHSLNKCSKIEHFHFWECLWNCWTCHQVAPLNKCLLIWNLDLPDMMSFVVFFLSRYFTHVADHGRSMFCLNAPRSLVYGLPVYQRSISDWSDFSWWKSIYLFPEVGKIRWKYVPLK